MQKTISADAPLVLVVEDAPLEQYALREVLGSRGYRVGVAGDGRQGYDMALLRQPDLIVLDVRMAGMDGFAVCRRLKANAATAAIPVIFLTGADSASERIEGLQLGAVDFVGKPFSAGELLARIDIHLRLARPTRDAPRAALPVDDAVAEGKVESADSVLATAAERYIESHLADELQLDELARLVGSYRERLTRAFQARHGVTVFCYIRDRRIARACAMLRGTDAGIAEIALAVGFGNPGNFATAFREKTGVTPGAYRRDGRDGRDGGDGHDGHDGAGSGA